MLKPKSGETYWVIREDGVSLFPQIWNNDGLDKDRLECGNVYSTREEAFQGMIERAKEKQNGIKEV